MLSTSSFRVERALGDDLELRRLRREVTRSAALEEDERDALLERLARYLATTEWQPGDPIP